MSAPIADDNGRMVAGFRNADINPNSFVIAAGDGMVFHTMGHFHFNDNAIALICPTDSCIAEGIYSSAAHQSANMRLSDVYISCVLRQMGYIHCPGGKGIPEESDSEFYVPPVIANAVHDYAAKNYPEAQKFFALALYMKLFSFPIDLAYQQTKRMDDANRLKILNWIAYRYLTNLILPGSALQDEVTQLRNMVAEIIESSGQDPTGIVAQRAIAAILCSDFIRANLLNPDINLSVQITSRTRLCVEHFANEDE